MKKLLFVLGIFSLMGCGPSRPPLKTVDNVDLMRFMGSWYVIASIPLYPERNAFNAIETYRLDPDGTVDTVFTFNNRALDGPKKTYRSRGYVIDKVNNSTWKIQFIWPFKAEYLITHLNADYSITIVSRSKRDYAWIMARSPSLPDDEYQRLVDILTSQGYDLKKLRRVPQEKATP